MDNDSTLITEDYVILGKHSVSFVGLQSKVMLFCGGILMAKIDLGTYNVIGKQAILK